MKRITIIGGGATGTLLAMNLIKKAGSEPLEINLIECREKFGRGVAYSTTTDVHLLNVPANKMGAFTDDIEHFYKWLVGQGYDYLPNAFVPRKIYGTYLDATLGETIENRGRNVTINLINDEAIDILTEDDSALVVLKSGEVLPSHRVVLAFGNFLPPHPKLLNQEFTAYEKYFQNPWNPANLDRIATDDDVLIIGMGLTMVDVLLSLRQRKHCGKIFAVSKSGLLPTVHSAAQIYPSFYEELAASNKVSELLKIILRHIKKAKKTGIGWRAVIDSMRPHTPELWIKLPVAEKQRFMRHLRRIWDVSRHRVPPECADIINEMQSDKQFHPKSGRLRHIEKTDDGRLKVIYAVNGLRSKIRVDAIFNCMGSESNFTKVDSPLIKKLYSGGAIDSDCLALGINANPSGEIIDRSGGVSTIIYTIGTALKGILWESTAMPEIRAQTNQLALSLLK